MRPSFYMLSPSFFGTLGFVWQEAEKGLSVQRVFLPSVRVPVKEIIQATFAGACLSSCPPIHIVELVEQIQCFLVGEAVDFALKHFALERCSEFQARVLVAVHEIPRGRVSAYGRIARRSGVSGGARAVGGALARNPFPIIIPCHRAIRSNGELGGYQGGLEMKRALLEFEGVELTQRGIDTSLMALGAIK
jgi:methylated-DNA-[protein]-cysteine S-methyltransferase